MQSRFQTHYKIACAACSTRSYSTAKPETCIVCGSDAIHVHAVEVEVLEYVPRPFTISDWLPEMIVLAAVVLFVVWLWKN